jgi:hypothetical protein
MNEQEVEKLGQEIAAKCNFELEVILAVAFFALTDANFHTEAEKIMAISY